MDRTLNWVLSAELPFHPRQFTHTSWNPHHTGELLKELFEFCLRIWDGGIIILNSIYKKDFLTALPVFQPRPHSDSFFQLQSLECHQSALLLALLHHLSLLSPVFIFQILMADSYICFTVSLCSHRIFENSIFSFKISQEGKKTNTCV